MTREAKIGMLTGLGVIVLIGVLLSSYLGNGTGPLSSSGSHMASLPVGEAFRQQTLEPMGVPALASGGNKVRLADGTEIVSPIDTTNGMAPLPLMVAEITPSAPVIGPVVSPVPTGPAMEARDANGSPPMIELADPSKMVEVRLKDPAIAAVPAAPTAVKYTVAPGDTLAKIAKKFYNSSKNSDVARIAKANSITDGGAMLMAGRSLTIPGVAPVKPVVATPKADGVVMYRPGDAPGGVAPVPTIRKVELPKGDVSSVVATPARDGPAATKAYVVQSGDTFEKIARKIAPGKVNDTVQKLMALNGIKNAEALRAGSTIKVP